jgi:hypothetical protein
MSDNYRIGTLQKRIKWIEEHTGKGEDIKEIKQELDSLLAEDAKYDKLRSLPLHSSKITRYEFVCGECFERVYKRTKKR